MRIRLALLLVILLASSAVPRAEQPRRMEMRAGSSLIAVIPTSPADAMPAAAPVAMSDSRATWHLQQTVAGVLKAVSFADPLNGYIAAELGRVYKTTNGGQSWTSVMNIGFPYYWYGVKAFSPQTALIVGFQNQSGAGVARWTDDGGATWTSDLVIDPSNWLLAVEFADPLHGVAYGNLGYVYVTDNGGRSPADWTRVATDPDLGWLAGNFTFRPDMHVYVTGINFCRSTDGGHSWSSQHSADPVFDGGCSFPDLLHGWTGGGQISAPVSGWVHRTSDGGATWSGRLMQPTYPIRIVKFFDESFGFAAGGNIYSSAGGIWSSPDGGTTWNLDVNTGAEMSSIDAQPVSDDSTDVWCVGYLPSFSGVIYKTRVARHEATAAPGPVEAGMIAGRAFPNPFFARTRIDVEASATSAAILDISGRLVRTLEPRAGILEWDGRDETGRQAPAGAYFVRVEGEKGQAPRVIRIR